MATEQIPITEEQSWALANLRQELINLEAEFATRIQTIREQVSALVGSFTIIEVPDPEPEPEPEPPYTIFPHGVGRLKEAATTVGPPLPYLPKPFKIITLPADRPGAAAGIVRTNLEEARSKNRTMLVVNLPLAWTKASPKFQPETTYQALQAVVNGGHNSTYIEIAEVCNDFKDIVVIFRLGHEHNGRWYAWSSAEFAWEVERNLTSRAVLYAWAWQTVVPMMRSIATNIAFDWNIASEGADPHAGSDPAGFLPESYPGDEYVDIIGRDTYGRSAGRNIAFVLNELDEIIRFAEIHGKPMSFPEVGAALKRPGLDDKGVAMLDGNAANWWDAVLAKIDTTDLVYIGMWMDPEPPGPYDFVADPDDHPKTKAKLEAIFA